MSLFVLDTDHVSLHQRKDPLVTARIANCLTEELAITVVTVGEQMRGRLAQLGQRKVDLIAAYELLRTTSAQLEDRRLESVTAVTLNQREPHVHPHAQ